MDAADAEALRHTLACQGTVLKQQCTLLRELMGLVKAIFFCVMQLTTQAPIPAPGAPASTPASQLTREPQIPHPIT